MKTLRIYANECLRPLPEGHDLAGFPRPKTDNSTVAMLGAVLASPVQGGLSPADNLARLRLQFAVSRGIEASHSDGAPPSEFDIQFEDQDAATLLRLTEAARWQGQSVDIESFTAAVRRMK